MNLKITKEILSSHSELSVSQVLVYIYVDLKALDLKQLIFSYFQNQFNVRGIKFLN